MSYSLLSTWLLTAEMIVETLLGIAAWITVSGLLGSRVKNSGTHRLQSGKEILFRDNTIIQVAVDFVTLRL